MKISISFFIFISNQRLFIIVLLLRKKTCISIRELRPCNGNQKHFYISLLSRFALYFFFKKQSFQLQNVLTLSLLADSYFQTNYISRDVTQFAFTRSTILLFYLYFPYFYWVTLNGLTSNIRMYSQHHRICIRKHYGILHQANRFYIKI